MEKFHCQLKKTLRRSVSNYYATRVPRQQQSKFCGTGRQSMRSVVAMETWWSCIRSPTISEPFHFSETTWAGNSARPCFGSEKNLRLEPRKNQLHSIEKKQNSALSVMKQCSRLWTQRLVFDYSHSTFSYKRGGVGGRNWSCSWRKLHHWSGKTFDRMARRCIKSSWLPSITLALFKLLCVSKKTIVVWAVALIRNPSRRKNHEQVERGRINRPRKCWLVTTPE